MNGHPMNRYSYIAVFLLVFFLSPVHAQSLPFLAGRTYCTITHPTEAIFKVRNSTCEKQHVIQQQSGGVDELNTVWWAASSHARTDVWNDKPWQNNRPWLNFGLGSKSRQNLEQAYMMGTFGKSWSYYFHDYNGRNSKPVATKFDGVSNALYYWSWLVNTPQKFVNKLAYIFDKGHYRLLIDMIVSIPVFLFELVVGGIITVVGVVLGTLLNPVTTVFSIPGGLVLAAETLIPAVFQFALGIFRVIMGIF